MTTSFSEAQTISTARLVSLSDPFERAHGGTLRTRAFISALTELEIDVSVHYPTAPAGLNLSPASDSIGADRRVRVKLGELKRSFLPMPTQVGAADRDLSRALNGTSADLLVTSALSQWRYSRRVRASIWLMDFMDVWSDFADREANHRTGLRRLTAKAQSRSLRKEEQRAAMKATLVSAAGWSDAQRLSERGISAAWLPTPIADTDFRTVKRATTPHPRALGFLANFEFWPNRDAAELLLRDWLPLLRANGWEIVIAGHSSSHFVSNQDGVTVLGPVADVDEFYARVDATAAPIRLGGGMKVKVVESLARGRPVIGTGVAFEGFPPELQRLVVRIDRDLSSQLDGLPRPNPRDPVLRPYRYSAFTSELESLLRFSQRRVS